MKKFKRVKRKSDLVRIDEIQHNYYWYEYSLWRDMIYTYREENWKITKLSEEGLEWYYNARKVIDRNNTINDIMEIDNDNDINDIIGFIPLNF